MKAALLLLLVGCRGGGGGNCVPLQPMTILYQQYCEGLSANGICLSTADTGF